LKSDWPIVKPILYARNGREIPASRNRHGSPRHQRVHLRNSTVVVANARSCRTMILIPAAKTDGAELKAKVSVPDCLIISIR